MAVVTGTAASEVTTNKAERHHGRHLFVAEVKGSENACRNAWACIVRNGKSKREEVELWEGGIVQVLRRGCDENPTLLYFRRVLSLRQGMRMKPTRIGYGSRETAL